MSLPLQQSKALFHKIMLAKYREEIPAPNFLKSFFQVETTPAKSVSIEVMRGTERVAVDVLRGAGSNRNKFSRYSEKEYIPPFYSEEFEGTQLDRYDRVFGDEASGIPTTIGYLARDVAMKYVELRNKIERAKEKQCSQILETGIVELTNHDNIDFKRKAGSKVDNTDDPWTSSSADVEGQLVEAGDFMRQTGKNTANTFNLILSSDEWLRLKQTDYFQNNANFQQIQLIDINTPQVNAGGGVFHGRISAGPYLFDVWTYDEVYEDNTGTIQYYWPRTQAAVVPQQGAKLVLAHAGVPAILTDRSRAEYPRFIAQQRAEYYLNNYIDEQRKSHTFEIYSAPLAVPVTVDMLYTMKTLNDADV